MPKLTPAQPELIREECKKTISIQGQVLTTYVVSTASLRNSPLHQIDLSLRLGKRGNCDG